MEKINIYHLNQAQKDLIITGLKVTRGTGQLEDRDQLIIDNLIDSIEICRDLALIIPRTHLDKVTRRQLDKLNRGGQE